MRLIVADGRIERLHFRRCDIGRIRDDQVKGAEKRGCGLPDVDRQALHTAGQALAADVLPGHAQRGRGDVSERHARVLHAAGDGKADAAGAGAQIQNARILLEKQRLFDGKLRYGHGVVAGNEHVGRDGERHAVEVPFTEDVGHGLSCHAAAHKGLRQLTDLLRGVEVAVRDQLLCRFAGGRADELPRDVRGKLALCGQQGAAGVEIELGVFLYHRSSPSFSGRTSVSASMPTSSMESSGSFVVRYCSHMPGADSARVSQLSWRPTRRLNS